MCPTYQCTRVCSRKKVLMWEVVHEHKKDQKLSDGSFQTLWRRLKRIVSRAPGGSLRSPNTWRNAEYEREKFMIEQCFQVICFYESSTSKESPEIPTVIKVHTLVVISTIKPVMKSLKLTKVDMIIFLIEKGPDSRPLIELGEPKENNNLWLYTYLPIGIGSLKIILIKMK